MAVIQLSMEAGEEVTVNDFLFALCSSIAKVPDPGSPIHSGTRTVGTHQVYVIDDAQWIWTWEASSDAEEWRENLVHDVRRGNVRVLNQHQRPLLDFEVVKADLKKVTISLDEAKRWMQCHGHGIQVIGQRNRSDKDLSPGAPTSSIPATSDPPWLSSHEMAQALGGSVRCGGRDRDGWKNYLHEPPIAIQPARRLTGPKRAAEWHPVGLAVLLIRHSTSRSRRGPAFRESDACKLFNQANAWMPNAWRQRWLRRDEGTEG